MRWEQGSYSANLRSDRFVVANIMRFNGTVSVRLFDGFSFDLRSEMSDDDVKEHVVRIAIMRIGVVEVELRNLLKG